MKLSPMAKNIHLSSLFILLSAAILIHSSTIETKTFNVIDYGAVGDGFTEDTQAFVDTWEATCGSSAASSLMMIPKNSTFLLQPLTFEGRHCNSTNITITIDGELTAPSNVSEWKYEGDRCRQWIFFHHMNGLMINGSGTLNGQGNSWWSLSCQQNSRVCGKKPTGFIIGNSNNVTLNGITFKDSPQMHIAFERSMNISASNLTIQAPEHSHNTDGIHIQNSQNISIYESTIGTGDDCISIGDGSYNISIYNITCGPGHGISIGSLGKHGERETVELVYVKNIVFNDTTNGVRIKTWQGGDGYARNITFKNIVSHGASNPIIIDQFYCDHEKCKNQTTAVEISDVFYHNISGISGNKVAVHLACSESIPCKNILMEDIYINSTDTGSKTSSFCGNVNGRTNGTIVPIVPCLIKNDPTNL